MRCVPEGRSIQSKAWRFGRTSGTQFLSNPLVPAIKMAGYIRLAPPGPWSFYIFNQAFVEVSRLRPVGTFDNGPPHFVAGIEWIKTMASRRDARFHPGQEEFGRTYGTPSDFDPIPSVKTLG